MQILPVMFVLWAIAVAGYTALMVYRSHLTQHETDQLFLNENEIVDFNHAENDHIIRRVGQLCPLCRVFGGAAALITVAIVGIFVAQALPNVKF